MSIATRPQFPSHVKLKQLALPSIRQIVAITGCNPAQATQVLSKYDNNVERAINSIFDDPEQFNRPHPPPSTSEANAVVPWTGGNNLNNNSNNAITSNTSTNNAAAASYDPHQEWSKPPGQPPSRPQTHTNTHPQQQSVTFKQPWEDAPPYYQGQGTSLFSLTLSSALISPYRKLVH